MDDFNINEEGYTEVYTHGWCQSNGRGGARAGYGVWFKSESQYNMSAPVLGRATNNNGEIQAVTAAVHQARIAGIQYLKIFTESQFVINCATKWVATWKSNGWLNKDRQPVANKKELLDMETALNSLKHWKFEHVIAHPGNFATEEAKKLARQGSQRYQEEPVD